MDEWREDFVDKTTMIYEKTMRAQSIELHNDERGDIYMCT